MCPNKIAGGLTLLNANPVWREYQCIIIPKLFVDGLPFLFNFSSIWKIQQLVYEANFKNTHGFMCKAHSFRKLFFKTSHSILLSSLYFIPTKTGKTLLSKVISDSSGLCWDKKPAFFSSESEFLKKSRQFFVDLPELLTSTSKDRHFTDCESKGN